MAWVEQPIVAPAVAWDLPSTLDGEVVEQPIAEREAQPVLLAAMEQPPSLILLMVLLGQQSVRVVELPNMVCWV